MSNEYKDYMRDKAQDVLLDNNIVESIEYTTDFHWGYLVIGFNAYGKQAYYVWLDDLDGWCWKEMRE